MYLNKAILVGNLTRDPELKALPSGIKTCSFSIATNRIWKDKNGSKQETADFHNIVVFGNQAEAVTMYLKKGSQVLVEGRIQTRSWEDKESGKKTYRTEIIAERVQFGTKPSLTKTEESTDEEEKIEEEITPTIDPETGIDCNDIPF